MNNCKCGLPAKCLQVKKEGANKGRWFLVCGSGDDACKFFAWTVAPPLPEKRPPAGKRIQFAVFDDGQVSIKAPGKETSAWLKAGNLSFAYYDSGDRCWVLPLNRMKDARAKLAQTFPGMPIEDIPISVLRLLEKPLPAAPSTHPLLDKLPSELLASLKPFQRVGLLSGLNFSARCLFSDEMGLGKSIQALATMACFPESWPLLIICPSSLRGNWKHELVKWLSLPPESIQIVLSGSDPIDSGMRVFITSYDLASRPPLLPKLSGFRAVIADESHYLKNPRSLRSRAILPLVKKAERALLLSGTPALARPAELWTSLSSLRPDIFSDKRAFQNRYCAAKEVPAGSKARGGNGEAGLDDSGSSNLRELNWLLKKTVMIRRLKSEVMSELPEKVRKRIHVDILDKEVRKEMDEVLAEAGELDSKVAGKAGPGAKQKAETDKMVAMNTLWRLTGQGKLPEVREYLTDLLSTEEPDDEDEDPAPRKKVIVFAHHIPVLDSLYEHLLAMGTNPIRIDGRTKPTARQPLVDVFQTDPSCRAAVLGLTAAGVGITLTKADVVVFAEIGWTPALLLQAEDRAHRIGREGSVEVVYLLAIEDAGMMKANEGKLKVVGKAVEGDQVTSLEVGKGRGPPRVGKQKRIDDFFGAGVSSEVDGRFEDAGDEDDDDDVVEIVSTKMILPCRPRSPPRPVSEPQFRPAVALQPKPQLQPQTIEPPKPQFKFTKPVLQENRAPPPNPTADTPKPKPINSFVSARTVLVERPIPQTPNLGTGRTVLVSSAAVKPVTEDVGGTKQVLAYASDSEDEKDNGADPVPGDEESFGFDDDIDEGLLGELLEGVEKLHIAV